MSTHAYHEDAHENGLADGCPRCDEHARHPFESLDDLNLAMLIGKIRLRLPARSENEAAAMHEIRTAQLRCARLEKLRTTRMARTS